MKHDTYHHGDLSAALVEAGIALLESEGLDAMTLRAAARSVGVSHAAPKRHFRDAEAFQAAVATVGYQRMAAEMEIATAGLGPLDALRAVGHAYAHFAVAHPNWYRAIFHPNLADKQRHPDLLAASDAMFTDLGSHVERAVCAGVIRRDDVAAISLSIWAAAHGITTLLIDGQLHSKGYVDSPELLTETVLRTVYVGLAPTPAGSGASEPDKAGPRPKTRQKIRNQQ